MTYYLGGSHNNWNTGEGYSGWSDSHGDGDTHGGQESGDGGVTSQVEYGDGESGDLKGNGVGCTPSFDPALIFEYHDTLQHSVMLMALLPLIR